MKVTQINKFEIQWITPTDKGKRLKLVAVDKDGKERNDVLNPLATIFADENDETLFVELHTEKGIVQLPLSALQHALKIAPKNVHSESWYKENVFKIFMNELFLLPAHIAEKSISKKEIVLPQAEALEAIDHFETKGYLILGWEGRTKTLGGQVGPGNAPQGTGNLKELSVQEAAQLCRKTLPKAAEKWTQEHPWTTDKLFFCITVRA